MEKINLKSNDDCSSTQSCYACVSSAGILGATTILYCFEGCR